MSWPTVPASELMLKRGGSVNPVNYPDETFELLSIPAFDKGEPEVVEGKAIGSSKSCVQPNDVLLSKIVPHIKRCWVVPDPQGTYRQIGSGEWIIFRSDKVHPPFLRHFLTSDIFHRQFMNTTAGVGGSLVRARPAGVGNIDVPLPPLPEQKRIAAILDKADAIRRKRQQAIQLADDFLRAVFLHMFGDPVTNPKGWETKALKDIARIQIGPFGTQLHKEDYIEGGVPLVNPTHIVKGQIVPKNDLTISAQKHAELPEYHLEAGDIIMGRRGEMGRCAVIGEKESGWLCGTGSLFLRPNKAGVFSEYLNKFLSSDAIKSHLESESQGATMPNLNKTIVGNIRVPVPSDLVLERFAAIKEKALGAKAMYSTFSKEVIFDAISQKAFSGQL